MSVTLPCKCTVSDAAGAALVRAQLIEAPRRVSPVFIQCSKKCRSFVPLDVVKRYARSLAQLHFNNISMKMGCGG